MPQVISRFQDIADLAALALSAGAVVVRNAGNTAWQFRTLVEADVLNLSGDLAALSNSISTVNSSLGTHAALTTSAHGGIVPAARLLNTTAPIVGGGDLSADRTLSMHVADATHDGYLSAVDWGTFNGKGAGNVTSVGMTVPSWLSISGSPVTGSGTLAVTAAAAQTANRFVATPTGVSGAVSLRAIVAADLGASASNAKFLRGDMSWQAAPNPFNQSLNTTDGPTFAGNVTLSSGQIKTADGPDDNTAATNLTLVSGKGAAGDGVISNAGNNGADLHVTAGNGGAAFGGGGGLGGNGGNIFLTPGTGGSSDPSGSGSAGVVEVQGAMQVTGGITAAGFTGSGAGLTAIPDSGIVYASEAANLVFASPIGSAGSPTYRGLDDTDLPDEVTSESLIGACTGFGGF